MVVGMVHVALKKKPATPRTPHCINRVTDRTPRVAADRLWLLEPGSVTSLSKPPAGLFGLNPTVEKNEAEILGRNLA